LWMSLRQGQIVMVNEDHTTQTFGVADGLDIGTCRGLYEDRTGTIWVAGNRALASFTNEHFRTLPPENWYPATLTGLVEDNGGDLWFSSAWGLVQIHRSDLQQSLEGHKRRVGYTLYDTSDGVA